MIVVLSWPDSAMSPNKRLHWAQKSKIKAAARQEGYFCAKAFPIQYSDGNYALKITFFPPTKRRYDLDNLLASCKAVLDGLAEGWGIDDKMFRPITIDFGPVVKDGRVEVEI